jgi:hypothetical protein
MKVFFVCAMKFVFFSSARVINPYSLYFFGGKVLANVFHGLFEQFTTKGVRVISISFGTPLNATAS